MKSLSTALLTLLIFSSFTVQAGGMGRLNGYAKPPSAVNESLSVANAVIVDNGQRVSNHGRLSAYANATVSNKLDSIPVLAGMKHVKPVRNTEGLGRLNGYSDSIEKENIDFLRILDTTNIAVWH